ncbi:MAG: hypothetical protein N3G77_02445 [Nitrososphaeria archaeon]|nr:hypothetical protein [Nitrososphaeria archaeon]
MMLKLREAVLKTIKEFNKYRGSVAEAELVKIEGDEVLLKISGSLCHTCGFVDYLEDFVYEMERVTRDYRATLMDYQQLDDDKFLVRYKVEESEGKD